MMVRWNSCGVIVAAVAGALALAGCKAQDQTITRLDYRPSKAAAATTGGAPVGVAMPAEAAGLPVSKLGQPIVADVVKQTGSKSARVVVADSIPKWVGNAVVGELKAAGVNAGLGLDAKPGRTIVKTEITELKNETKSQWSSNAVNTTIALEFKVERDGVVIGTVQQTGMAKVEKAAKLPDVIHDSMENALRDCLNKATPYVVDLIRKGN